MQSNRLNVFVSVVIFCFSLHTEVFGMKKESFVEIKYGTVLRDPIDYRTHTFGISVLFPYSNDSTLFSGVGISNNSGISFAEVTFYVGKSVPISDNIGIFPFISFGDWHIPPVFTTFVIPYATFHFGVNFEFNFGIGFLGVISFEQLITLSEPHYIPPSLKIGIKF
jgi:hypothetical protein